MKKYIGILLIFAAFQAIAQQKQAGIVEISSNLVNLKQKLEAVGQKDPAALSCDMYMQALARIDVLHQHLEKNPGEKNAAELFGTCSLLVEAAMLQVEEQNARMQIMKLSRERDSVLSELNVVHQKITDIERKFGTKLQSDLLMEQLKSEKMAEEAKKIKEDAEKRFDELKSALIQVKKDARGTIISMSDILFAFNKADLTAECNTSLAKIAGILLVYKKSRISVEGHTDNQGAKDYNQKLSEKRADNVMNFLIKQGVTANRLTAKGFGERKPVATNNTKEGRQQNRRVDLIVKDDETLK